MLPARDVERRIEGIKSRVSELNDKCKVPSVFCYKSKHSNSLIVQGDTELLFSVNHEEGLKRGIPVKTYTVCLPPLQKSLAKMTIRELQANLIGIMKDLTHSWDGESPQWWPKEVPFRNPRKTPKKLKGRWCRCLRSVIKACYAHAGFDTSSSEFSLEPSGSDSSDDDDEDVENQHKRSNLSSPMNMTPASTSLDVEVPTQLQNPIGENNSSNTDDTCTVPQASEPHRSTSSDVHATVQPSAACYESPSNSSMPQSSDGACSLNTVPSSNVNHNTTMLTQGSPQPHLAATTFVNFSPLPMQMCPSVGMMPARQTLINPSMTNSTPAQAMMPPQRMVAAAPQHRMGMQQSNNGMGSIRPSALMPHMMGYQYGMRPPMISSGVPPHVNPHITPRQHLYSQMPWEIRAQGPQMMHRPYSMMNSGYPQQNSMMGQQPGGPPPPTPHHGTMLTAGQPQMPMARPPGLFICRNQQVRHIQHRSPQQQQLMQQQLQNQQTQQQQEQSLYANQ